MNKKWFEYEEKRKYIRFPVIRDLGKPISMRIEGEVDEFPAFILDLSAGGIGILTLKKLKPGAKLQIELDLPGLEMKNVKAEVMWVAQRSETYRVGIEFLGLPSKIANKINNIARDYLNCEIRIALGHPKICRKKCRYYPICDKLQKT